MPNPAVIEAPTVAGDDVRSAPVGAAIAAIASSLPARTVANEAIAARIGVDAGWIATRTGVHERRIASADESLADLATSAGATALERAGRGAGDVDLILVATCTPDDLLPHAAPLVAERLGAGRAGAIDVGAACTGFLSALDLASATVEAGRAATVLTIGADLMSRLVDFDDKRTAGLFGDAAGAAVVVASDRAGVGPIKLHADGSCAAHVTASHDQRKLRMDGRATFRAAVAHLSAVSQEVVADAGLTLDDVDLFVYHQANSRILSAVGERLELPTERVVDSLALHGNTSAASIPVALDAAMHDGRLRNGSTVLLAAFGAGLTWGAGLVEWGATS